MHGCHAPAPQWARDSAAAAALQTPTPLDGAATGGAAAGPEAVSIGNVEGGAKAAGAAAFAAAAGKMNHSKLWGIAAEATLPSLKHLSPWIFNASNTILGAARMRACGHSLPLPAPVCGQRCLCAPSSSVHV